MTDARTRLSWVVWVGAMGALLDHAAGLALLAAGSVAALTLVGGRWSRAALVASAAVAWSTVLSQGLFFGGQPRTAWLELGPVVVWSEGVAHGLVQSSRFVATTCAGAALALSTPPDRLSGALVALRVPWGAAFLAVTALRFVPVAAEEWWTVRQARARRGGEGRRGPWSRLRVELAMVRPVVARALRRAAILAESLELRGFDPVSPPAGLVADRWPLGERLVLVSAWAVWVALAAAELVTWLYLHGLVYAPWLRPLYAFVRGWC